MPLAHIYVCSESSSLVRLRVPSRFLVRPQLLSRIEPLPAGRNIPGASLGPFVTTDHAVPRPQRIDAQIRRHLCAHLPLYGGFKDSQQLCPGVSDTDRKAEGFFQILREEGHDTRS